jgi:MFS family permease
MIAMGDLGVEGGRARAFAMFQGTMLIGTDVGPALGGIVASQWGLRAPFLAYAARSLLAAAWIHLYVFEMIVLISVVALYPAGILADRWGRKPTLVPGLLLVAVGLALAAASR